MKKLILMFAFMLWGVPIFAHATEENLEFTWNQVISSDFAGWKLYIRTEGGNYDFSNPWITIPYSGSEQTEYTTDQMLIVPDNQDSKYYFVLKAFDTEGLESSASNEVSAVFNKASPNSPFSLKVIIRTQ